MTRKIPKKVTRVQQLVPGDVISFTYKKNAFRVEVETKTRSRKFFWVPQDPHLGEAVGLLNGLYFEASVKEIGNGKVLASPHPRSNTIGQGGSARSITSLSFTMDMVTNVRILKPARESCVERIGPMRFKYTYGDTFFVVAEYKSDLDSKSRLYKINLSLAKRIAKKLREIVDWKQPPEPKPPKPPKVKRGIVAPKDLHKRDVVDIELHTLEEIAKFSDVAKEKLASRPSAFTRIISGEKMTEVEVLHNQSATEVVDVFVNDNYRMGIPWVAIRKAKRRRRKPEKVARKRASPPDFTIPLNFSSSASYELYLSAGQDRKPRANVGCKHFDSTSCGDLLGWLEWFIAWAEQSQAEKKSKKKKS